MKTNQLGVISTIALSGALIAALPAEAASYGQLTGLYKEWRKFERPTVTNCVPDYSAAALAKKAEGLKTYQGRLDALKADGWSKAQKIDLKIVRAEMSGLDFDLRVLKPWGRDPTYYANVFNEQSDVPEHEGPSIEPAIDLWAYKYPLSKADQKGLTCLIGAIPAILDAAKVNLKGSNARDLWVYGKRAFKNQSLTLAALEAGTLDMRTLEGTVEGSLDGAGEPLRAALKAAREATDAFSAWLDAEASSKTGPSGIGKENYDWYMANVALQPYTWEQQVTLLKRELDRSRASLEIEQYRNRALPPLDPVNEPDAYMTMATAKMQTLTDFLIEGGLVDDKPYYRDAMKQQIGGFTPPEKRNFFDHGMALDPTALFTHSYHWIELARLKHEPNKSLIRSAAPLSDMYAGRSEGLATAMEELLMHAGLYDDAPRVREIVWAMLANRAARGLASLHVQANEMTLKEAGAFHGHWTPRQWSDPESDLVAFEQLLYLRLPGYGTSYVTGKLDFDRLISDYSYQLEQEGKAFSLPDFFKRFNAAGVIAFPLIEEDMLTRTE